MHATDTLRPSAISQEPCRLSDMTWYETAIQILLIRIANGSIIALMGYPGSRHRTDQLRPRRCLHDGTMISLSIFTWVPNMGVRRFLLPDGTVVLLVIGTLLVAMIACLTQRND
jgi:hypothetical protein